MTKVCKYATITPDMPLLGVHVYVSHQTDTYNTVTPGMPLLGVHVYVVIDYALNLLLS